jgi:hypothetical protein
MRSRMVLTVLAVLGCLVASAQADVLYQDGFNRNMPDGHGGTVTAPLNTSAPDIRSGTYGSSATATWISGSSAGAWQTSTRSGGYASCPSNGEYDAYLPLQTLPGYVYTVSVNVQQYSGDSGYGDAGRYFVMGFINHTPGDPPTNPPTGQIFSTEGTGYVIEKTGPSAAESFDLGLSGNHTNYVTSGNVTYYPQSDPPMSDLVSHNLKIVLDATGAQWKLAGYLDNAATPFATYSYGTISTSQGVVYANPLANNYVGICETFGGGVTLQNFVVSVTPHPGDANWDGTVNGADLNAVLSNYNQTGATWEQGDFNGDGTVNGADLNAVLSYYNQTYTGNISAAVPEPSVLWLGAAGVAGLIALVRRKRK